MGGEVAFEHVATTGLTVDAIYKGGVAGNVSDDPVGRIVPVGNVGGVRSRGTATKPTIVALVSSGENSDWPDELDRETGVLTYFGDNRSGGSDLHDTPKFGNTIFRNLFDYSHGSSVARSNVCPILVFARVGTTGRDYRFLGLAVPGSSGTDYGDDLVAIWRSRNGVRYQNYRASFTILDEPTISRAWLTDILAGHSDSKNAPPAWLAWRQGGVAKALKAPRTIEHRTRAEQEPSSSADVASLAAIHNHFRLRPHDFEQFAADLVELHLPSVASLDVTRRSRDGGRDAVGLYRVGNGSGSILIDFSMEAKCYAPENSVGVREMSRLISRLRHRNFGVLVTTSYLDLQAYKELKEDQHPIVVIAGADIIRILRSSGILSGQGLAPWLTETYPSSVPSAAKHLGT